jgi:hypothetical protein
VCVCVCVWVLFRGTNAILLTPGALTCGADVGEWVCDRLQAAIDASCACRCKLRVRGSARRRSRNAVYRRSQYKSRAAAHRVSSSDLTLMRTFRTRSLNDMDSGSGT